MLRSLFCLLCVSWGVLAVRASALSESDVSHTLLSRAKRSTTCAPKYKIASGHTACLEGKDSSVVSPADQQVIVDKHNEFRANASNPTASNMLKMRWDDEIAMLAQKWADQCLHLKHDTERNIPGRLAVGQNIAINVQDWPTAVRLWHQEIKDFTYDDPNFNFGKIGHYTQVMWAETTLVGCGMNSCNGENHHICNYGVSGNYQSRIQRPYKDGSPCADCQGHCVDSSLCDCNLTCLNGGTLHLNNCTCTCKAPAPLYMAPDCSLNCTGTSDESWCEGQGQCPGQFLWCPHKCGYCPYAASDYTAPTSAPPTTTTTTSTTSTTTTTSTTPTPSTADNDQTGDSPDPNNSAPKDVVSLTATIVALALYRLLVIV